MAFIFETENFVVEAADRPHVDRDDGGHIRIIPKTRCVDRTQLPSAQAFELMMLTMVVGEAMTIALKARGLDIGRINYQDNGNWGVFKPEGPYLHIHIYGRAQSAKTQLYGQALQLPKRDTGFYDRFKPLNAGDVYAIRQEIERLSATKKYKDLV